MITIQYESITTDKGARDLKKIELEDRKNAIARFILGKWDAKGTYKVEGKRVIVTNLQRPTRGRTPADDRKNPLEQKEINKIIKDLKIYHKPLTNFTVNIS